jgi:DNA repair exonuclease SbcCD ATPase subunit
MNTEQPQDSQKRADATESDRNGGLEEGRVVERIRDILVGSQIRDYDGRLQRIDERLTKEATEARASLQRRFDSLENFLKSEVESFSKRLNAEQSEYGAAIEKLGHDLSETVKAFESKIKNLHDYAREIHDLHRQLLEQSKALSAELKEKHEQMQADLNRNSEQIRTSMLGRQALAEVLSEMAERVKNDSRLPGR